MENFFNLVRQEQDKAAREERLKPNEFDIRCCQRLEAAGVEAFDKRTRKFPEDSIYMGSLHGWMFEFHRGYIIAEGPGIPLVPYAWKLHEDHGQHVRVDGHCGCPAPYEQHNGLAIGKYHVDTDAGLQALVTVIRKVVSDAAVTVKGMETDKAAQARKDSNGQS
jgi:hypothetical protein